MTPGADSEIRIIDACANRAAEGLRTLEDLARFSLAATGLASDLKGARHDLAVLVDGLAPHLSRARSRDAAGDVGRDIKTDTERTRRGMAAISSAAGSRATQAIRTLEELAKLSADPLIASSIETIRYRVYDLAAAVTRGLATPGAKQFTLCVLITKSLCRLGWERVVEHAIEGGADCFQLREKGLGDHELLVRAKELVGICQAAPIPPAVFINDRVDIALLSGADGVHLGQTDLGVAEARKISGDRLLIGVSTANMQQAHAAVDDGADLCGVGPMFESGTKLKEHLSGPAYLRSYLADPRTSGIPHLAISGISSDNIGELADAGCRGIAVSSSVCAAEDPAGVCASLRHALEGQSDSRESS